MLLLLVFATADSSSRGDCDQGDETCAWDQADQPATAAQSSPAKPADDQCERWADAGECKANAAYMEVECAKACRRQARGKPPPPPPPETPDVDAHCGLWASKGECEKNAEFMATNCRQACRRHADELKDKDPRCAEWAAQGECDRNASTKARCRTACLQVLEDRLDAAGCADVVARGECGQAAGLVQCRSSCRTALQRRLSPDTEGNCWYWGTDGECANNSVWMRKTCPRTCVKLEACSASTETASADEGPHSSLCSEPFECPVANDERADCAERARRGECRAASRWRASPLTITCMLSCHLLDPSSVSHAVTRPPPLRSAWVDAAPLFSLRHRHGASACHVGSPPAALLGGRCPNLRRRRRHALHARFAPQRQHGAGCPAPGALLTPRLPHPDPIASPHRSSRGPPGPGGEGGGEGGGGEGGEGGEGGGEGGGGAGGGEGGGAAAARLAAMIPKTVGSRAPAQAWDASAMRVQTVYDSPRVRLVHNMVTAEEAAHLIALGKPRYARSSTARAGSDD